MNFQLVSAILRGVWLIPQDIAETYMPAIAMMLEGHPVNFDFDDYKVQIINPSGIYEANANEQISINTQPGAIVNIPIKGPMMKNDQQCGPVGMNTIGSIVKQADADPNVKGILLSIESPGGQSDGTKKLADIIKGVSKPTVAHVDGMATSAAYWIASAADKIVAEPKATIGSIGTMLSFADFQPSLEQKGVKFHRIVSDLSPDKNSLFEQVRSGDYAEYRKTVLNPLALEFKENMKANRPAITDAQMTGKTWFADQLAGTMVDSIGTIDDALALLTDSPDNKEISKPKFSTNMTQFKNVNSVLGVEQLEMTDEGVFLNQEQIDLLNTALEPAPAPAAADPEPEPAPQPAAAEPNLVEQLLNQMSEITARLAAMENGAGATAAVVKPTNDPGKQSDVQLATDPKLDFWGNVNKVKEAYL